MPVRITSPVTKLTVVVLAITMGVTASVGFGVIVGPDAGFISATGVLLTLVALTARTYRGSGEAVDPPREWWRMTATPLASYALAVLFGSQALFALGSGLNSDSRLTDWCSALVHTVIALAYLQSGSRLLTVGRAAEEA